MTLGRPRAHPKIHGDSTGRMVGTRQCVGALANRHPNVVMRRCEPVACDADSRLLLYDVDVALETLADTPKRVRGEQPVS
jgi:hypothetical protein